MTDNNKTDEKEKSYYWLTTDYQSNFQSLKVEPVRRTAIEKHMKDCLWFEDDEKEVAMAFLREVKKSMKKAYENVGKTATWMTDEWISN